MWLISLMRLIMQGVAEAECRRAADVAEAAYAAAFSDGVEPEEAVLDAEHLRCMGIAHQAYADVAVGGFGVLCACCSSHIAACCSCSHLGSAHSHQLCG